MEDKDAFLGFLDASLQVLRKHLASAYDAKLAKFDASSQLLCLEGDLNLLAERQRSDSKTSVSLPASPRSVSSAPSSVRFGEETHIEIEHQSHQRPSGSIFPEVNLGDLDDLDREEDGGVSHGDSSALLQSDLQDMTESERRMIRHRLRVRLGVVSRNKLVSGKSLHDSLSALGLTRYTEQEINDLINHLATFVSLNFEEEEDNTWSANTMNTIGSTFDRFDIFGLRGFDAEAAKPVWQWPSGSPASFKKEKSTISLHREKSTFSIYRDPSSPDLHVDEKNLVNFNVVPLEALMDVFLAHESSMHKKIFGPRLLKQFRAVKEILLAGDTNRLVAELTFVRMNDLAVPSEPIHILLYLEPLIALIIVANGISIGIQTDPMYEGWPYWMYVELGFVVLLSIENLSRTAVLGCRDFWCGAERGWNWFDSIVTAIGIADVSWQLLATDSPDIAGTLLLRCFRLVRLARVVRVFRLTIMSDLRLMVRGLVAGIWTLALAFCLLFAVLYLIAGLASFTIGRDSRMADLGMEDLFYNIPWSMFTAFRCFIGDCNTMTGEPIMLVLAEQFGVVFVFGYVCSYMLVAMGIFNVILAVYVDITMRAAKENDAVTAEQYNRESIRIARATRELLKKFAAAYHVFHVIEDHAADISRLEISHGATLFTDDEIHDDVAITKELFFLVIQDPAVQALMDELDLPPNRAQLFEVIDSDGSGTLHIQELVQGLLKLRGEVNKGDVVAPLLAARSVQTLVASLQEDFSKYFRGLPAAGPGSFPDPFLGKTPQAPSVFGPRLGVKLPQRPEAAEAEMEPLPPYADSPRSV